jgi:hypothetical protein
MICLDFLRSWIQSFDCGKGKLWFVSNVDDMIEGIFRKKRRYIRRCESVAIFKVWWKYLDVLS